MIEWYKVAMRRTKMRRINKILLAACFIILCIFIFTLIIIRISEKRKIIITRPTISENILFSTNKSTEPANDKSGISAEAATQKNISDRAPIQGKIAEDTDEYAVENTVEHYAEDIAEGAAQDIVELYPYTGLIENIFFHPLIAYPDKAFDNDGHMKSMDDYFVTADEFHKILQELYARDYILIDISLSYDVIDQEGIRLLKKKQLMLPEGKKPLVLSVDDMNYYKYMKENGTIHKLILDNEGNIAALTYNEDGTGSITYDNAIVPVLENFIKEHKDFSFMGARGIIALTGYRGVLGYNTHEPQAANYETEKADAQAVINRLKELGWTFASHGYYHYDTAAISFQKLEADTAKWFNEVGSLVGATDLYIYPFGSVPGIKSHNFRYLIDRGFNAHFGVASLSSYYLESSFVLMDRIHVDGIYFRSKYGKASHLFDVAAIIDNMRP